MELRPYQQQAVENIFNEWKDKQKTLLVLPTGCGKTIVFAKVAEECVRLGHRVLILAHRGELLEQAQDKILKTTGLGSSLEKAESTSVNEWFRITVGSVQTLQSEKRLERFDKDHFDTIIIDEAHHCVSNSYQNILNYFSSAKVLGVTATPDRADMKNIGSFFESLAFEYSIAKAIKEGYLSKIKAMTIPLSIDLSNVGVQAGDFKAGDVATALDPYLEQIADEMMKHCQNRKTLVFLPLVATSKKFKDILNRKGFNAAEVNGNSEDRKEVIQDFENGKYNVLCNSMLLTEGFDCPAIDCVIVLRATKSRSLYCQMVGRGTRLHPGKEEVLLLDFLWHTEKHELCRPAHLICANEDVKKQMIKKMEEESEQMFDIMDVEKDAESDVLRQREEKLAEELKAMKSRKRKLVDPLQFEMSIQAEDLASYVPTFAWEMGPATPKQLQALEKYGIYPDEVQNNGYAQKLLDRLNKRKEENLATPKQIRLLESKGFVHVGTWSFDSASRMIGRIAINNWRVPNDINPKEYVSEG